VKVTEKCATQGDELLFVCDFSPLKSSAAAAHVQNAAILDADYISVAYNPGKAVRADSAMLAYTIKQQAKKDVIFNLASRDMNKLAMQSHLLGAEMIGLENVMVVGGDRFNEKDLARQKEVSDFRPTELIQAIGGMNQGLDFKGFRLKTPTDICVGASIDLDRGVDREARLTYKKVKAGAQFFLAQPVFDKAEVVSFLDVYESTAGRELDEPVFFGLQVLVQGGVLFSNVPETIRQDLDKGRSGVDIALGLLAELQDMGIKRLYLIAPILKGGARDYAAAQTVIEAARRDQETLWK
jgi:5,10-methylenetetrahydrofolate reductase